MAEGGGQVIGGRGARQVYLLCGPPLAGKSAFCARIVERLGAGVCSPGPLGDGFGEQVRSQPLRRQLDVLRAYAAAGRSVVVDDTLCYRWLRDRWRRAARDAGLVPRLLLLSPPRAEIMARVIPGLEGLARPTLALKRVHRYLDAFEWPADDEGAVDVTTTDRQDAWLAAEAARAAREDGTAGTHAAAGI
jgi:predicted kinase